MARTVHGRRLAPLAMMPVREVHLEHVERDLTRQGDADRLRERDEALEVVLIAANRIRAAPADSVEPSQERGDLVGQRLGRPASERRYRSRSRFSRGDCRRHHLRRRDDGSGASASAISSTTDARKKATSCVLVISARPSSLARISPARPRSRSAWYCGSPSRAALNASRVCSAVGSWVTVFLAIVFSFHGPAPDGCRRRGALYFSRFKEPDTRYTARPG